LRLKTWNYSLPGPYFVTICTFDRSNIFDRDNLRVSAIDLIKKIATELNIKLHCLVIAIDHLHILVTLPERGVLFLSKFVAITKVRITQSIENIWVDKSTPTRRGELARPNTATRRGELARPNMATRRGELARPKKNTATRRGELARPKKKQWVDKSTPTRRIWQRSFYDHIIRNERDFIEKARYIDNHPLKEEGNQYAEWH